MGSLLFTTTIYAQGIKGLFDKVNKKDSSGRGILDRITKTAPGSLSNDDIINFVNMLSADYIFLKGEMDVNSPAVTGGQQQRLAELNAQWLPIKNEYSDIQKQILDFNALCRNAGIEKITIPQLPK